MKAEAGGKKDLFLGGICVITDRASCDLTCLEMTQMALRSGIKWVQLREKKRSRLRLYRMALRLREITRDFGACLIVNDFVDIAASVDADGVHLGQEDIPIREARKILGKRKIVGISTHSVGEAVEAEKEGADYIGFGPIYKTATKDAGSAKGTEMLMKIKSMVNIPVVAIGGICPDTVGKVLDSGADAVAAASSILKGDIQENAGQFLNRMGCI
jgi:thiamine-phosphate pyrophosphorylase